MKKRSVLIVIFVAVFVGMWGIYENWPIVQSEAKIRSEMMQKFPVGTNKNVIWKYADKIDPGLYGATHRNVGWWLNNDQSSHEEIGDSRIRASISDIGIIDVTVIWLFDKEDKLIEIYAWKTIDFL